MYISPYVGKVNTGYTFEATVNRLKRKLAPMSGTTYTVGTPHNNNQYWVRPTTAHNTTRNGTSYATAWGGFSEINWGLLGANTTLMICGQFDDQILEISINGSPDNFFDIRFDYAPDPGIIYRSVLIPTEDWIDSGTNGEYYLEGQDNAEIMLFEDGERLFGCSKSSNNTKTLRASLAPINCTIDITENTLEITSVERDFFTGQKICIPGVGDLSSIPAPLAPNVWYYAIAVSSNKIKFAESYSDAINGIAIDLTSVGTGNIWKLFNQISNDGIYNDPEIGSLLPGQYWWEGELQRIYYKPSSGVISNHILRIADDRGASTGAAIYFNNSSYVRVFGGGEYGGIFGQAPLGKVGQCHSNAIQANNSNYITINGLQISSCRSGIAFVGGTGHTTVNNLVFDCGWHGIGGERGSEAEDGLTHERNYVYDVGQKHDFGDTQGIIFNRNNHNSIIRRNFVQRVGRNNREINAGGIVSDTSDNCYIYRNVLDNNYGGAFRAGPGGINCVFACNIIARNNSDYGDYSSNEYFVSNIINFANNGSAGYIINGYSCWGNIIANSRAPKPDWNSEYFGVIKLRAVNLSVSVIDGVTWERNAVLNIEDSDDSWMYVIYTNDTSVPVPGFYANNNLFVVSNDNFYVRRLSSNPLITYSSNNAIGTALTYFSAATNNDTNSVLVWGTEPDFNTELSSNVLEFLRQDDSYDSKQIPSISLIGTFPFDI